MRTLAFVSLACLASLAVACVADKPEPDDDFSELGAADLKADHGSNLILLVGELGYGETSPTVRYTRVPRFRAVQFQAQGGDAVDIWVRGLGHADAVAYLLDSELRVLAWNDDASKTTLDARIVHEIPSAGTYFIVFRDYYLAAGRFQVSLAGSPAGDCAPATEHNRHYVADSPETCAVIKYTCPAGTWHFASDCGCGCEQDPSCPEVLNCKPPIDCSDLIEQCPLSVIGG
jgi:hypothetical protein